MNQEKFNNGKATADDYELLVLMSWKDEPDYGIESERAFSTFYKKHRVYLLSAIRKKCERVPYHHKKEIIDELLNDVFKRIYEKAETIRNAMEKYQHKSNGEFGKILRAYLGKLANKETIRYLEGESAYQDNHERLEGKEFLDPYPFNDFDEPNGASEEESNKMTKLAEEALMHLKPMEKDILLTKMMYYQDGKDLPDEVVRETCAHWGINPGYMRTNIARAKAKFTDYISEKTGLEPLQKSKDREDIRISVNMRQQ